MILNQNVSFNQELYLRSSINIPVKNLQCLVLDDGQLAIDILTGYIEKTPFLKLKNTFTNPLDALTYLQKETVDLIFLDIQMPELTGIQFMKLLQSRTAVIIVSAYQEYAIEGYEHDVVDYLLKPVSFERFLRATQKALSFHQPVSEKASESNLTQDITEAKKTGFIFIKTDGKIVKINLTDIILVEGLRNYISIHTTGNKKIISLQNLKVLEEILPADNFFRVHKSYIVALDKIDSIEKNRIFMGEKVIPIGETFLPGFLKIIKGNQQF